MKPRASRILPPLSLLLAIVLAWHIASVRAKIGFWVLPGPLQVLRVFQGSSGLIWMHLVPTFYASISGLAIAIGLGVTTAVLMHGSRLFARIIYPYMVVSQTVPIIAVAPLIIIWFGYGISAKIFTVTLVCFFPVALGLFDGLKQVSVEQIRLLKSMGASTWKIYLHLKIPASLPAFFTGLKLAATYSVMGAVIGEWLGGNRGLGIYMTRATKSFQTAHVFAVIIVIVLLSMFLFGIVAAMDRFFLKWHYRKVDEYEEPGPELRNK